MGDFIFGSLNAGTLSLFQIRKRCMTEASDACLAEKCLALFNVNTETLERLEAMPNQVPKKLCPKEIGNDRYGKRYEPDLWTVTWGNDNELKKQKAQRDVSHTFDALPFGLIINRTRALLTHLEGHSDAPRILRMLLTILEKETIKLGRLESKYKSLQQYVYEGDKVEIGYATTVDIPFLVQTNHYEKVLTSAQIIYFLQAPDVEPIFPQ